MTILGVIASSTRQGQSTDTGAMFPISATTIGSAGASYVEFTNIPQTYSNLEIRITSLTATLAANTSVRFNNDTGATYSYHYMYGAGSGSNNIIGGGGGNQTAMELAYGGNSTNPSATIMSIMDYTSSKNKTVRSLSVVDNNGSGYAAVYSGAWYNTAAITTIRITSSPSFNNLSNVALYGIKG